MIRRTDHLGYGSAWIPIEYVFLLLFSGFKGTYDIEDRPVDHPYIVTKSILIMSMKR